MALPGTPLLRLLERPSVAAQRSREHSRSAFYRKSQHMKLSESTHRELRLRGSNRSPCRRLASYSKTICWAMQMFQVYVSVYVRHILSKTHRLD